MLAWSKYLLSPLKPPMKLLVVFYTLFMKQINTYQEYVSPYLRYYDYYVMCLAFIPIVLERHVHPGFPRFWKSLVYLFFDGTYVLS